MGSILILLITVSLCLGLAGLAAFFWALRNGQYEDLDGDAGRILLDEPPDTDSPQTSEPQPRR